MNADEQELEWLVEEFQLLYVDNLFATDEERQKLRDELIEKRALETMEKITEWKNKGIL